jgi:hypothetical protein
MPVESTVGIRYGHVSDQGQMDQIVGAVFEQRQIQGDSRPASPCWSGAEKQHAVVRAAAGKAGEALASTHNA